jgi:DNA-binding NtrC family response regulator
MKMPETVNVLFVDDETGFLDVITKRMSRRDINAFGMSSGEEALALIEKQPPDVVVLDVKMPGCRSGIDILKEIKSRWPLIEVIMLTGHAMLDAAREGMESGAFDFIVKPADFDELFYKIKDACQKKKLQESKIKGIEDIIKKQK